MSIVQFCWFSSLGTWGVILCFFFLFFCQSYLVNIEVSGGVGFEIQIDEDADGCYAGDGGQELADPEGAPPEAVHPQTFDDAAAQAVPGGVAQSHLAIVAALFGQEVQQDKAGGIPERFV